MVCSYLDARRLGGHKHTLTSSPSTYSTKWDGPGLRKGHRMAWASFLRVACHPAAPGIEPGNSRTFSEKGAARPSSQLDTRRRTMLGTAEKHSRTSKHAHSVRARRHQRLRAHMRSDARVPPMGASTLGRACACRERWQGLAEWSMALASVASFEIVSACAPRGWPSRGRGQACKGRRRGTASRGKHNLRCGDAGPHPMPRQWDL